MDTHLRGTYLFCRRVGREMIREQYGRVINISFIVGLVGFPMRTEYGPAKAGILMLTKQLALEWAQFGITVNAICPGYIRTPSFEGLTRNGKLDPTPIVRRTPVGRLGTPDEISRAVMFLGDEDSGFIKGIALPVDGGWTAYGYL